ncbi:hypothetical protein PPERSA_13166 [Pseudocohnilembus persalinus]|uniref:Uncharacterized protein n=1 Tax=Pseudocohnilembus persalinus TaxID=266149 RepID=A0A0V0QLP7_PSEPJ|nr:hypothetical protein PPERSA_13166 [Pseudocohnilembus persalinus]|eukprot:KRX02912.1 hypothetical protein PPERSA_13166 [Pseudocohnilembus persalinus]
MGNICSFVSDNEIIRASLKRDKDSFGEFKNVIIKLINREKKEENGKNLVKISGSGEEESAKIQEKINEFFGNQVKIELKYQKIVNSLVQSLDKILGMNQIIYNFQDIMDPIELGKKKNQSELLLKKQFVGQGEIKYPYILVNLRGGVSFYQVNNATEFNRLQGSIIGESMLEGLINLFDNEDNQHISDIITESIENGDNKNVDLTVEDIYGENTEQLGLPKDLLASSMGKLAKFGENRKYDKLDIVRSLVQQFCINLGQLTALTCQLSPDINQAVIAFWKIDSEKINFILQCFSNYYGKGEVKLYFVEKSNFLATLNE